jgi:hypothetical protein
MARNLVPTERQRGVGTKLRAITHNRFAKGVKVYKKVNKVVGKLTPIQGYLFRELAGKFITVLTVDSNDKHYFHLWGLQKPLVAFATRDFYSPSTAQ